MPPTLALSLCVGFVFWLYRQDVRMRKFASSAMWIPAVWLGLVGARPVSYWLGWIGLHAGPTSSQEGSPLDLIVFVSLIVAALLVLRRRRFNWGAFILENKALILIYAYLAISATWSHDGLPTFKRAVKDFGNVLVALVLLTSSSPLESVRSVFVRVSYLLLPFSVVFIKYFPEIGHVQSRGGDHFFCGVAQHKNTLGLLVMVLGLVIVLDLMELRKEGTERLHRWIRVGMLAITAWLLVVANSVTSQVCLVLGVLGLWMTGLLLRRAKPGAMLFLLLAGFFCLIVADQVFDLSGIVLGLLGRNSTLTGRVEIWAMVREHSGSMLGYGFYSFWNTPAGREISGPFLGTLNTVHNGYLEMLLDGGVVGFVLLLILLLVWGRTAISAMLDRTLFGRFAFVVWVLALIYNNSETSFFRMEPLWFTAVTTMIVPPGSRPEGSRWGGSRRFGLGGAEGAGRPASTLGAAPLKARKWGKERSA